MSAKIDTRDEYGRRRGLIAMPRGIYRPDRHLAGTRSGKLVIPAGVMVTTDGDQVTLDVSIKYALDEPLPPQMLLGGEVFVTPVKARVFPNRTTRCVFISGSQGDEVWLYVLPQGIWMFTEDPKWIAAILD